MDEDNLAQTSIVDHESMAPAGVAGNASIVKEQGSSKLGMIHTGIDKPFEHLDRS